MLNLKDRTLHIKMTKDSEQPRLAEPAPEPIDITATVSDITSTVVTGTIQVMGAYMTMDTVRKIAIHKFTRS